VAKRLAFVVDQQIMDEGFCSYNSVTCKFTLQKRREAGKRLRALCGYYRELEAAANAPIDQRSCGAGSRGTAA
jgi:hypothetical protein